MKSAAQRVLLVLVLSLSAHAQEPSANGVNFYSLEREFHAGQDAAAQLMRTLPVVHDPQIDNYLDSLTSELVRHADSRFAYSFTVYEDRKQSGPQWVRLEMPVDAFHSAPVEPIAIAGGPILIPLSLIADAPDEAALVFQLSHAIAHVALRHSTKLATREELTRIAAIPLEQQAWRRGPITAAAAASGGQIVMEAAFLSFARQFELAADFLATGMMAEAGYDPAAAIPYLEKQPRVIAPRPGKIYSVHPPVERRVETIKGRLEKLPAAGYDAQTGAFEEIKALAAMIH